MDIHFQIICKTFPLANFQRILSSVWARTITAFNRCAAIISAVPRVMTHSLEQKNAGVHLEPTK